MGRADVTICRDRDIDHYNRDNCILDLGDQQADTTGIFTDGNYSQTLACQFGTFVNKLTISLSQSETITVEWACLVASSLNQT